MRILHYALGFPPWRTGGLTKYCVDLMLTQKEQGYEVALLWPGRIGLIDKRVRIRKRENWKEIGSYELVNPLPIALDEGILNCSAYTAAVDLKVYARFLEDFRPDTIHIHTWMGLHREFLEVTEEMGIRTVFTSHDYYGLCPKVTLFHGGMTCDEDHNCADCVRCNQTALSLKKITLMQSPLYRRLKNTHLLIKIRQKHRKEFFEESSDRGCRVTDGNAAEYRKLREYYISMLEKISFIHFNSTVAEQIYRRYMTPKDSAVISITHRDIKDHRKKKKFDHETLRLTYLGPAKPFKGFPYLIKTLDELWADDVKNFELHIYSSTSVTRPYITVRQEGYLYGQLEEIFGDTDLLVVPSRCYETFGFTVLEALSYGVPVLVSENVGAKDLLDSEFIYSDLKKSLKDIIMDRQILIYENMRILSMKLLLQDVTKIYKENLK